MTGDRDERTRWNARYRRLGGAEPKMTPPAALHRMADHLPEPGRGSDLAVDLAGGHGGAGLYLGRRRFAPMVVDVSDVALGLAASRSEQLGLDLSTVRLDLDRSTLGEILGHPEFLARSGGRPPILITCFHYLQRTLLSSIARDLPPGSTFAAAVGTTTNLERNERPPARFLLQPGELRSLVVPGAEPIGDDLVVVHDDEGWHGTDLHEAELVVR
ncbi:MAG: hypothetical protein ACR2QK_21200, partial [Acidimicrobiales bacterium]